jgi:hypothetical protein
MKIRVGELREENLIRRSIKQKVDKREKGKWFGAWMKQLRESRH